MKRSFWAPAVTVIVAALVLLLAGAGAWVTTVEERSVGDVVVTEPEDVSGTEFAPGAMVVGLAGLGAGIVLALVRGPARRVIAAVAVLLGLAGVVSVATGIVAATGSDGRLTPAPPFAAAAAAGMAVGGAAALRAPARPPTASKYRVAEEQTADDEWSLAANDDAEADQGSSADRQD